MSADALLPASPWAWYRGDTLAESYAEGDQVVWPPKAGDLTLAGYDGGVSDHRFTADAVNGRPGVYFPDPGGKTLMAGIYSPPSFAFSLTTNKLTVAMVCKPAGGTEIWFSQGYWVHFWLGEWNGALEVMLETDSTVTVSTPAELSEALLVGVWDEGTLSLWVDGVKRGEAVVPSAAIAFDYIEVAAGRELGAVPDVLLWDRAITEAEQVSLYDYYRCHYYGECSPEEAIDGNLLRRLFVFDRSDL